MKTIKSKNLKSIKIILLLVVFSFAYNSNAQHKDKMQQLKTLKIGFITESLELTPEEATDFWPIYNLHQDKIHVLYHENRNQRRRMKDEAFFDKISDDEAEKILNKLLVTDKNIEQEKSAMFEELKTVLPPKKLLKLHRVENDFNRKILEQYRKRKEGEKK